MYIGVSKCAMHIGHSISSCGRADIVQSAKRNIWSSLTVLWCSYYVLIGGRIWDGYGVLSIASHMNDWHLISHNVCSEIDVLLDSIVRDGNISCDGFTLEEINFMVYDMCDHWNFILIEF